MRTETKMYAVLTENGSIDWFTGEVAMLMITPAMMIPVWSMTRNMINRSYRPEFPADQQYAKSGVRRLGPNTDVAS